MTAMDVSTQPAEGKGLKPGALGLVSSIVVGVASTAPAYSLAASLGYVVVTGNGDGIIGVKAPLIMVLAFIPMYFIAVAYAELNKAEPDCGTTFTWAARAFGTRMGWMGGWGIIAADVIVMANLAYVAGSYSFSMFGLHDLAGNTWASTFAGIVWIVVMTYICYRGIEVSARIQYALLGFELVTLFFFIVFITVVILLCLVARAALQRRRLLVLDACKRLGKRENANCFGEIFRVFERTKLDGNHPAKTLHLTFCKLVLRM